MAGGVRKFEEWRAFFEAHGFGPYTCEFCGGDVPLNLPMYDPRKLTVHHVDEDRLNNVPSNLTIVHQGCHQTHHHRGKAVSEETRDRQRAASTGRKQSAESRAKISTALAAHYADPDNRAALIARAEPHRFGAAAGADPADAARRRS